MSQAPSQDEAASKSTQTFITALVLNLAVAGVELLVWLIVRNKFRNIYSPRTFLPPPKKRISSLPTSLVGWLPAILRTDAKTIIHNTGLDAYMFVRFLYLMLEIFIPVMLVTWVILLPVDAASSGGNNDGIAMFTFGNVGTGKQIRYVAHLLVAWVVVFYILYLLKREYAAYVTLRQDFLISQDHSRLVQSKTVMITGVPKDVLSVDKVIKLCDFLPGGVKRVWLARDLKDLPDAYDRRTQACLKLEAAEFKLLKTAVKAINKKKGPEAPTQEDLEADKSLIDKYVPRNKRPTHRLGKIPCMGEKVDTIEWAREEIKDATRELDEKRDTLYGPDGFDEYPAQSTVFVAFNKQIAAHICAQALSHHLPLRMNARYLDVAPPDVIWSNLSINPYQARVRYWISWAATLGLIILWAFPVAFVGLISNVSYLCSVASWLEWLCALPSPVNGIIQGALPPIALAILFILVPIFFRLLAQFEGVPLRTEIELSLMTRYFGFIVIHGFLIVTLASGLVAAIPQIAQNPASAVTLLAENLPKASTFFLTYIVTTGLSGAAGSLLQIVPLILYYVKLILLGSTPRKVYTIKCTMRSVQWGTVFPNITLLTVISITYSIIAPLVAGFAVLAFGLFWFVWKYLFLWVMDVPPAKETGGRFYPKALTHIFVGLYIMEVCLCGLFFLATDTNGNRSAIPEGALMVVLIVITIFWQLTLESGYKPLIQYLPLTLAERMDQEREGLLDSTDDDHSSHSSGAQHDHHASSKEGELKERKAGGSGSPHTDAGTSSDRQANAGEVKTLPGDEHTDKHAFDHDCMHESQQIVWLPEDPYGFYRHEVAATRAARVDVSTEGAVMNEKGKADVERSPPGMPWEEVQINAPAQRTA